jgi:hypothetical protein
MTTNEHRPRAGTGDAGATASGNLPGGLFFGLQRPERAAS